MAPAPLPLPLLAPGPWLAGAAVALALDAAFAEPPARLHPVVAMGRLLRRARARARGGAGALEGAAWWAAGAAASVAPALALQAAAPLLPAPLAAALLGAALWPLLSGRALLAAVARVEAALRSGDLAAARARLARDLVSRDASALDPAGVAGAAASSLAENLNDAVVSPLLLYALLGLPGAALGRWADTADSVLGYREPGLESFGGPSARLDDLLAAPGARASALLLVLAAPLAGGSARRAWRALRRDADRTPSPNGGRPMAALAGALDVRLVKAGAYALHDVGRPPGSDDLARARRLASAALALGGAVALGLAGAARG